MMRSGRPSAFARRATDTGFKFFEYISSCDASVLDSNTGDYHFKFWNDDQ